MSEYRKGKKYGNVWKSTLRQCVLKGECVLCICFRIAKCGSVGVEGGVGVLCGVGVLRGVRVGEGIADDASVYEGGAVVGRGESVARAVRGEASAGDGSGLYTADALSVSGCADTGDANVLLYDAR